MDRPTATPSGYLFDYDAIKSYVIHFNTDPITKKKCNISNLIEMTTNKTFESVVKRSFIEANNVLSGKDSLFYVLDIDK